uniref:Uncharacterized protein n=1 Tax=Panulirus argus virus 1 TaxID=380624 RepID=A0A6G9HDP2_9VIRU|nr:hypothetical protein [Panulirus argus virus 1]
MAELSAFQYVRNIVNGTETSHLPLSPLQKQALNVAVVLDAVTRSGGAFTDEIVENIDNAKYAMALLTAQLTKNRSSVRDLTSFHVREWIDKLIAIDYSKEKNSLEVFSSCLSFIITCMLIFERDNIDNLLSTIESKILCLTTGGKGKENADADAADAAAAALRKRKTVNSDRYAEGVAAATTTTAASGGSGGGGGGDDDDDDDDDVRRHKRSKLY